MLKKHYFYTFWTILEIFTFMLVEKSWNCYNKSRWRVNLRQKVLKALANPPRIFYVPYNLAMLNFFFWFMLFVVIMAVFLILPPHDIPMWYPLVFLGLLFISHMILGIYSRKDSQIAQIILSTIKIFNKRIPKRLKV